METRPHTVPGALHRIWSEGRTVERIAYVVGALLFACGVAHLGVLVVSGGTWAGPLSMRKPTTFGLSFGLTLVTVAWASSLVAVRERIRTALLGVFTAACVLETALVGMQAWRGVPSHFNFETGFDNAVSMALAAGGGVIVVTVLSFTAATLVGVGAVEPPMRLAVRFGFAALLVSMAIGAAMIANGVVEARTGDPQVAYATAGSLKPVHAVAMHAVLVLPGLAWLLGLTGWDAVRRMRQVRIAAAAYAVLIAVTAVESFRGVPPTEASSLAVTVFLGALAVLLGTGAVALSGLLGRDRGPVESESVGASSHVRRSETRPEGP